MNKTKIEYADYTWNPVTGCLHECEYCYARKQAKRFSSIVGIPNGKIHDLPINFTYKCKYPYGFDPTFHRYRLDEPSQVKTPSTIFVCSMADLFGEWVPDEWIQKIFEACADAPQHRYLFLTKNPKRYIDLLRKRILPLFKNMWFGSTTETEESPAFYSVKHNTFVSIEPIMSDFNVEGKAYDNNNIDWAIIGAETGKRKNKVVPKREWIEKIVEKCRERDIPVFMKNSLAEVWGEPLIQEFPWGDK